ncbi:MAG: succinate dehydrogenase assembly factor 2 [Rhodospirillaceae bacterium]|jgi:antitoxin CptB
MDAERKRMLYRATHRGMKETDRLVGGFAEAYLADMPADQTAAFEALLDESDNDLLNWIMEREAVPAHIDTDLIRQIINFKNTI